jgi:hypothetical protein
MIKLRIVKIVTNLNPAATTVKLQIVASKIVISIWSPYLPTSGGVVLNNSDILRILGYSGLEILGSATWLYIIFFKWMIYLERFYCFLLFTSIQYHQSSIY